MLNWAARYFPILRELKQLDATKAILEVGSGSIGVGEFYHHPFVGCDMVFPFPPRSPMLPVVASAVMLPFAEHSFDAVIVSDVLEHVPPEHRPAVIREALRITRKVAIFGFPSGTDAFEADRSLAKAYDKRGLDRPEWLQEHMLHPFPERSLFENLEGDWIIKSFGNENLDFHYWLMQKEIRFLWRRFFSVLLRFVPRLIERVLLHFDHEPYYRLIFVVQKKTLF